MAEYQNTSGTAVNLPLLDRDVEPGEVVTVPDDVLMPPHYFTAQGAVAPAPDYEE